MDHSEEEDAKKVVYGLPESKIEKFVRRIETKGVFIR